MDFVAIMLFTQEVLQCLFLFQTLVIRQTFYFEPNLNLVWYIKLLLIKKNVICCKESMQKLVEGNQSRIIQGEEMQRSTHVLYFLLGFASQKAWVKKKEEKR